MTQRLAEREPLNGKERRSEASRAALLSGARQVLAEHGYADATVQLITEAAGRSHGTFYLHFENKEDIYATLLEEMRTRLHGESKAVWHSEDPLASVEQSIEVYVRSFARERGLWLLLDGLSATSSRFRSTRASMRRALVQDIRKGIESSGGVSRLGGLDPDLVSGILAAMLEETCATFLLYREEIDSAQIVQHTTSLWGRILGYLPNGYPTEQQSDRS